MPDLPKELIRVNAILHEYTAIHDAIFKFSWRKALPIPGLFKPTDFGAHLKDLSRLASKLTILSSALKADSESLEGSHQYAAALLEAVQALIERLHDPDARIVVANSLLERAWGKVREQKPEDVQQAQIDLSTLSEAELAIMVKLVESGRLRPHRA